MGDSVGAGRGQRVGHDVDLGRCDDGVDQAHEPASWMVAPVMAGRSAKAPRRVQAPATLTSTPPDVVAAGAVGASRGTSRPPPATTSSAPAKAASAWRISVVSV